jgi:hypothetical protein
MNVKTLATAIILITSGLLGAPVAQSGSLVDMQLLARAGYRTNLASYWYRGQNYVEGRQNQEFRVRLRNKSGERVMAVLSIDGVNAISGETAGVNQTGYVLAPYQTLDVDGWRKSDVRTAAFYFTHISDSYAARTQRPDNVGVIGAAIFRELRYQYDQEEYDEDYDEYSANDEYASGKSADAPASATPAPATPAPSKRATPQAKPGAAAPAESKSYGQTDGAGGAGASAPGAPLGTGHGRQEYRPSVSVEFQREPQVFEVLKVRYDSRANLIAQGVIPRRGYRSGTPEAFPEGRFVPDPH